MNYEKIGEYLDMRADLFDALTRFSWCMRNKFFEDAMGWQLEYLMLRDELDEEPSEITVGVMRLGRLCQGVSDD